MSPKNGRHSKWHLWIIAMSMMIMGFVAGTSLARRSAAGLSTCPQDITCVPLSQTTTEPVIVTLATGTTAQFNSADRQFHHLVLAPGHSEHHDDHTELESGTIGPDEGWRTVFDEKGTYRFADKLHPNIHITVLVFEPGGDYRISLR